MKITILGGGSFGTALACQIAENENNQVTLLVRNEEISEEINREHVNSKYFPNKRLPHNLKASTDLSILGNAELIFLAVPTKSIPQIIDTLKKYLKPESLVVNVAKGLFDEGKTIVEYLREVLEFENIITLKGASFSVEMINSAPTLVTLGFENKAQLIKVETAFSKTNIYLDFTTDIRGVELLSALKNIYAILLGHIDAKYNAANTRFLFLTKAFSEIKIILKAMGGKPETMDLSCGIGDISLTALNDLSRNRTLGLLIGKGFYNPSFQDNSVVLEGIKTLKLIDKAISEDLRRKLPLLQEMISLLVKEGEYTLNLDFDELFKKNYTTVLTYGTFDLLHYGHLEILRRAKQLGDRLIVGLSTDKFNEGKDKVCIIKYEKRKQLLEALPYVDLVIPENTWDQKAEDVQTHHVDVFVMGSDWEGKFDNLKEYCEVRYFPRTRGISTSALKKVLDKDQLF